MDRARQDISSSVTRIGVRLFPRFLHVLGLRLKRDAMRVIVRACRACESDRTSRTSADKIVDEEVCCLRRWRGRPQRNACCISGVSDVLPRARERAVDSRVRSRESLRCTGIIAAAPLVQIKGMSSPGAASTKSAPARASERV